MTRTRWIILIAVLLIAMFAVVVGGFFWPRPQFRKGPWAGEGPVPADSVLTPIDEAR
ncbi:MAG: hypothetical protein ACREK3_03800 [Gemmatimonadota bacterium]